MVQAGAAAEGGEPDGVGPGHADLCPRVRGFPYRPITYLHRKAGVPGRPGQAHKVRTPFDSLSFSLIFYLRLFLIYVCFKFTFGTCLSPINILALPHMHAPMRAALACTHTFAHVLLKACAHAPWSTHGFFMPSLCLDGGVAGSRPNSLQNDLRYIINLRV